MNSWPFICIVYVYGICQAICKETCNIAQRKRHVRGSNLQNAEMNETRYVLSKLLQIFPDLAQKCYALILSWQ